MKSLTALATSKAGEIILTLVGVVLTRWLLELATPEEDIETCTTILRRGYSETFRILRWYNAYEIHHQRRGEQLLQGVHEYDK